MQKHMSLSVLLLAAIASADPIASVTVAGRTFSFSFEDEAITDSERSRIALEVAALWEDQPGSIVQQGAGGAERLFIDSMWATPYANSMEPPCLIVQEGTNQQLRVNRSVSAAYQQAFLFADVHTNEVAALSVFVEALSASSLSNATPSSLSALLFNDTVESSEDCQRIVGELLETHFCHPSILGLYTASDPSSCVPAGTLLSLIPCHDRATGHWDLWGAAWLDGRWQLIPPIP